MRSSPGSPPSSSVPAFAANAQSTKKVPCPPGSYEKPGERCGSWIGELRRPMDCEADAPSRGVCFAGNGPTTPGWTKASRGARIKHYEQGRGRVGVAKALICTELHRNPGKTPGLGGVE
jgi:hypothetical protein